MEKHEFFHTFNAHIFKQLSNLKYSILWQTIFISIYLSYATSTRALRQASCCADLKLLLLINFKTLCSATYPNAKPRRLPVIDAIKPFTIRLLNPPK